MKFIYLLAMIAWLPAAHGQDFCKRVIKDTSEDKMTFNFSSPYDQFSPPPIRIIRNYSNDKENPYDNFNIVFQIFGDLDNIYTISATGEKVEKQEKNVVIEFDDKTKITDDTTSINHDFSEDKTQSMRFIYFPVTENNIKLFTTKKIVKFSLAGYEQIIPIDSTISFQQYMECIYTAKK